MAELSFLGRMIHQIAAPFETFDGIRQYCTPNVALGWAHVDLAMPLVADVKISVAKSRAAWLSLTISINVIKIQIVKIKIKISIDLIMQITAVAIGRHPCL